MYSKNIFCLILILGISFLLFESCSEKESIEISMQVESVSPLKELFSSDIFRDTNQKFCFELVFPIELLFSNETTKSINSYEELMSFSEKWYKENADNLKIEPTINYPIKAILKDEVSSELNDDMAFLALIENCLHSVHHDFLSLFQSPCYKIDYPITLIEKDGTKVIFYSYDEVYQSVFTTEERQLIFDFPFSLAIGSEQIIINSEADLYESIYTCHDYLYTLSQYYCTSFSCYIIYSEILYWLRNEDNYRFLDECFNINYPVTIISEESDDLKISNNEEFKNVLESILKSIYYYYEEESTDFDYPIMVTLVEESRTVLLNSAEEFIKIFEHCR